MRAQLKGQAHWRFSRESLLPFGFLRIFSSLSIAGTTTGKDIFDAVLHLVKQHPLALPPLVCLTPTGAPSNDWKKRVRPCVCHCRPPGPPGPPQSSRHKRDKSQRPYGDLLYFCGSLVESGSRASRAGDLQRRCPLPPSKNLPATRTKGSLVRSLQRQRVLPQDQQTCSLLILFSPSFQHETTRLRQSQEKIVKYGVNSV
ncbi:hypothetical protein GWK47_044991 [Chionoecetes opilio]|uniref:Uncharacterized protein n=1 Tax=Chionoecetes opilio TaxID=41210 RepID=A0A8J4YEF6_CHIOP|nr:hypothetical protein GWK47_044991 [Chionoecetes opilio]